MKVLFKVSFADLLMHKKRTILQIIGVLLSVVMLMISFGFLSAMNCFIRGMFKVEYQYDDYSENIDWLIDYNIHYMKLHIIGLGIMALIIFFAILLINSVFAIDYGERVKLLGLLSSMGASTVHKSFIVFIQTVIILLFSVPFGVLIGYEIAQKLIVFLFNTVVRYFEEIDVSGFYISSNMVTKWLSIVVVTALLSTLIPIIKSRKNIIDLLHINNGIRVSLKKNLFIDFFEKIFGIIGTIAAKNYNNNRVKFRMLSVSMSAGMIMLSFSAILNGYMMQCVDVDNIDELASFTNFMNSFKYFFIVICSIMLVNGIILFMDNINLRMREFAMFRSAGMDYSMLRKMIYIECLYYGIYSLVYGFIGSFVADLFVFANFPSDDKFFVFPYKVWLLSFCFILFIVNGLMIYSVFKIRNRNIIDELKVNE